MQSSKRTFTGIQLVRTGDRDAIPGSVLKIEADNFDPKTGRQRQLWCQRFPPSDTRSSFAIGTANRRCGRRDQ